MIKTSSVQGGDRTQCDINFPCTMRSINDPGLIVEFSEWGEGRIVKGEIPIQVWYGQNESPYRWVIQGAGEVIRSVIMDKFESIAEAEGQI